MEHIDGQVVAQIKEITGLTFADILQVYYGQQADSHKQSIVLDAAQIIRNSITAMRRHHGPTLTVIAPGHVVDDYCGGILRGVQQASASLNYNVVVHWQPLPPVLSEYSEALFATDLVGQGLFLLTRDNYEMFVPQCRQRNCPYVLSDSESHELESHPCLQIDSLQAVNEATHYLFEQGHRRIGYIAGRLNVPSAKWRLQGYKAGLEAVGLPLDEALIVEGDWMLESGREQAAVLLQLADPPTAIMAANDLMAIGALLAIKSAGLRVPEDVSLIGFDDIGMASTVTPALTTIRQPLEQLGQAAVDMLHQMIQQGNLDVASRFIETELIIRESVQSLKQA
ncbi:MAG: substrate-binding domain-containing protein [Anaerolineae bacterium]|nr:substrate-binding domain-containing protein [Anaerolineae bacterium]